MVPAWLQILPKALPFWQYFFQGIREVVGGNLKRILCHRDVIPAQHLDDSPSTAFTKGGKVIMSSGGAADMLGIFPALRVGK